MVGRTVGSYRIVAQIGEGGMGIVYLAEHPMIGKKVAIKFLHAELAKNAEAVSRFFNEARAVNAIAHENIVDIADFAKMPEGDTYFIMELLEGESLAQRLHRGTLEPGPAADIAIQIASACEAAHKHGVVHRDLKPDNIYLTRRSGRDDFVKVLDFGIAKLTGAESPTSHKTRTGMVIGTPAYMSPEQCSGKGNVDGRSDIYALGMMLYEMLTGRVAFNEESYTGTLVAHLTQVAPPPRQFNPFISEALEAIILKCLEKDRAARYPTMAELAAALAPFATLPAPRAPVTPPPVAEPVVPKPTTLRHSAGELDSATVPRRRAPIVAGVAALAIAAAGGVWAFGRSAPAPAPAAAPAAQPAPAAQAPAPAAQPPAARPARPATVRLRVDSTPPGAAVVRRSTGAVLGTTPADLTVDRSAEPIDLVLRKDGFADLALTLTPDRDLAYSLALEAAAPRGAAPAKSSHPRAKPKRPADSDGTLEPEF